MWEINSFRGKYAFLSNMFPCEFLDDDKVKHKSVEHYYQSYKTVIPCEINNIRCAETPMESKRLGRKCKLRAYWDLIKDSIMEEALRYKFKNEDLKNKLIATHPCKLIEGNTWGDIYWGEVNGEGLNKLGILLMKIRDEMISSQPKTREEILDKEMRILEERINMTEKEEVKIIEVTPENFNEIKDDLKFPENEAELKEFIEDNKKHHDERIAKNE